VAWWTGLSSEAGPSQMEKHPMSETLKPDAVEVDGEQPRSPQTVACPLVQNLSNGPLTTKGRFAMSETVWVIRTQLNFLSEDLLEYEVLAK
jgi:hypothetical protein